MGRFLFFTAIMFLFFAGCKSDEPPYKPNPLHGRAKQLVKTLKEAHPKKVMVVSKSAACPEYPMNSRPAILKMIKDGVDLVEVDVQKTADQQYVLLKHNSLFPQTGIRGQVSRRALTNLTNLPLNNGKVKLPEKERLLLSLKQAFRICSNRILLSLSHTDRELRSLINFTKEHRMLGQVIFKVRWSENSAQTMLLLRKKYPDLLFLFMMRRTTSGDLLSAIDFANPDAIEISFSSVKDDIYDYTQFVKYMKCRAWVNTFAQREQYNGGLNDAAAMKKPEKVYGRLIEDGFSMICTEQPQFVLDYLRRKNFHP